MIMMMLPHWQAPSRTLNATMIGAACCGIAACDSEGTGMILAGVAASGRG
jgi:hypothetical protein